MCNNNGMFHSLFSFWSILVDIEFLVDLQSFVGVFNFRLEKEEFLNNSIENFVQSQTADLTVDKV
jgi:hypothetical protein